MIVISYESVNGGVNNLAVAHDTETGETSVSWKSKERAQRALKRKLAKRARDEVAAGLSKGGASL